MGQTGARSAVPDGALAASDGGRPGAGHGSDGAQTLDSAHSGQRERAPGRATGAAPAARPVRDLQGPTARLLLRGPRRPHEVTAHPRGKRPAPLTKRPRVRAKVTGVPYEVTAQPEGSTGRGAGRPMEGMPSETPLA
ncbi:hypothetical protein GCM10018965_094890 [Nonomuraea roseola]